MRSPVMSVLVIAYLFGLFVLLEGPVQAEETVKELTMQLLSMNKSKGKGGRR